MSSIYDFHFDYQYFSKFFRLALDLSPLVCGVLLFCLLIYSFLRRTARVSCWFCQKNSRVDQSLINNWVCPLCDQYNGFTENGDYNKALPPQWDSSHNRESSAVRRPMRAPRVVLCSICTHNQALKIQHRSTFVPTSEVNFDEEAERFNRRLEVIYRLCTRCEVAVHDELQYQLRQTMTSMPVRRPYEIVVPPKAYSLSDWLFVFLRIIPIVISCIAFLPWQYSPLEMSFISLWLLLYIFVYISRFCADPNSFLPFVIMMFSLVVNIASQSSNFTYLPFESYLTSDAMQYLVANLKSGWAHTLMYLLVAWKSTALIKPPLITVKPLPGWSHQNNTTTQLSIDDFSMNDLGGVDRMLSRIEITRPLPKKKTNTYHIYKRFIYYCSSTVAVIGIILLYLRFGEVNS